MFLQFASWVNGPLNRHLNRRRFITNGWVVNDEKDMKHVLAKKSYRCVMTDYPLRLKKKVQEAGGKK